METMANEYMPLQYDEERLNYFYTRAVASRNLSRTHAPKRDEVDLSMFADAIIGFYVDERAENHESDVELSECMARVAFVLDFLQGVPLDELNQRVQANPMASKMGVREYALGVAGEGARHFRTKLTLEEEAIIAQNRRTMEYSSVDEFVDLDDTIKRLFHDDHISSGMAQSLLLLFGQGKSNAPKDLQVRLIKDIKVDLERRLAIMTEMLPHDGDELVDKTFVKGWGYVKEVLRTTLTDVTLRALITREAGDDGDPARYQQYRSQVLGHMGYVLDRVYRRNQLY